MQVCSYKIQCFLNIFLMNPIYISVGYDLLVNESQTVKTNFKEITLNFYLMEQLIIKIKDKEKYMLILSLISLTNNVFIENYYNMC